MKVLYDHQVFSYQAQGGVSRYFSELIRGLESRGLQTERGWRWSPNRYLPGPDLWADVRFKGKALLRSTLNRRVSRKCLNGAFDLFHPTYYDPYFLPLLRGRPFVLTIHDMTHELFPADLPDAEAVTKRKKLLTARAARVVAVSENTKADAVRLLDLDPSKVEVIPHGNGLRPGNVELLLPGLDNYWLYVGSRKEYKDFSVLVKALGQRQAGRHAESLVMVGGGTLTPKEKFLLEAEGLAGRWLQSDCSETELAGWYSGALALVYPSRYEGFGMPLLEAMAWGCPVVASRASSLPEVGGDAALYFAPGNAQDLTVLLDQVTDPSVRHRLVTDGLEREKAFTWDVTVKRTLDVYRQVLS